MKEQVKCNECGAIENLPLAVEKDWWMPTTTKVGAFYKGYCPKCHAPKSVRREVPAGR